MSTMICIMASKTNGKESTALLGAYHFTYIAVKFVMVSVSKHMHFLNLIMQNYFACELRTRSVCKRAMFASVLLTYIQYCI